MKTKVATSHRLLAYGSIALGSTAVLATQADAATIVDINSNTYDTGFEGIGTIELFSSSSEMAGKTYVTSQVEFTVGAKMTAGGFFRRSADDIPVSFFGSDYLFSYGNTTSPNPGFVEQTGQNGALLNSTDNWFYAVAEDDGSQRLWLQFSFGNNDGNFSIVKAVIPGEGETINNAAAAASAVPEPSAIALLARRRRLAA